MLGQGLRNQQVHLWNSYIYSYKGLVPAKQFFHIPTVWLKIASQLASLFSGRQETLQFFSPDSSLCLRKSMWRVSLRTGIVGSEALVLPWRKQKTPNLRAKFANKAAVCNPQSRRCLIKMIQTAVTDVSYIRWREMDIRYVIDFRHREWEYFCQWTFVWWLVEFSTAEKN